MIDKYLYLTVLLFKKKHKHGLHVEKEQNLYKELLEMEKQWADLSSTQKEIVAHKDTLLQGKIQQISETLQHLEKKYQLKMLQLFYIRLDRVIWAIKTEKGKLKGKEEREYFKNIVAQISAIRRDIELRNFFLLSFLAETETFLTMLNQTKVTCEAHISSLLAQEADQHISKVLTQRTEISEAQNLTDFYQLEYLAETAQTQIQASLDSVDFQMEQAKSF